MKSTRLAFILVSLVTIILLAGSVVLQRMVFSAAESSSSVYISPSNFIVKPDGQVKLDIISDFSIPAFVTAGQFVFEYDDTRLEFVESKVSGSFESEKIVVQNNKIYWAVTPGAGSGIVHKFSGSVVIGQLIFNSKGSGSTNVSILPEKTIISAIDPDGSTALYNTVDSVQGSIGEITSNTDVAVIGDDLTQVATILDSGSTTQKITRDIAVPMSEKSAHIIELSRLGLANIAYGKTKILNNLIKSSTIGTKQTLEINSLEPDTKYFYQIKVLSTDGEHVFSSPVKTFNTKKLSDSEEVDTVELVVEDSVSSEKTNIFITALDRAGDIIHPGGLTFNVITGEATLSPVSESLPEKVSVVTLINTKQVVVVTASLGDKRLAEISINFNPEKVEESAISMEEKVSFNTSTQITLATLLLVILLTGLALVRLLRVK